MVSLQTIKLRLVYPKPTTWNFTYSQIEKEHISINLVIQGQKITKDLAPGVGTNLGKVHLNKGDALLELSLKSGAPESNFKLFEINFFKTTRMKRIIPLCLPLVLLTLFSCHTEEDNTRKPNILLIIAEDISPMLGCYGDAYATTPRLDDLASRWHSFYQRADHCTNLRAFPINAGLRHIRHFTRYSAPEKRGALS
jgi:hypothetical protein